MLTWQVIQESTLHSYDMGNNPTCQVVFQPDDVYVEPGINHRIAWALTTL